MNLRITNHQICPHLRYLDVHHKYTYITIIVTVNFRNVTRKQFLLGVRLKIVTKYIYRKNQKLLYLVMTFDENDLKWDIKGSRSDLHHLLNIDSLFQNLQPESVSTSNENLEIQQDTNDNNAQNYSTYDINTQDLTYYPPQQRTFEL